MTFLAFPQDGEGCSKEGMNEVGSLFVGQDTGDGSPCDLPSPLRFSAGRSPSPCRIMTKIDIFAEILGETFNINRYYDIKKAAMKFGTTPIKDNLIFLNNRKNIVNIPIITKPKVNI